jgi:hypothetical protein
MTVLPKRLAKYGLTLHPTKTRVSRFTRPPHTPQGQRAKAPAWPGTFALLGFTHYWGRSRRGNWVVKRKTAVKRLSRALQRFNAWCRHHRHAPVAWQHVASILGRPDQVVERIVNGMWCSSEDHAAIVRPQTVFDSGH